MLTIVPEPDEDTGIVKRLWSEKTRSVNQCARVCENKKGYVCKLKGAVYGVGVHIVCTCEWPLNGTLCVSECGGQGQGVFLGDLRCPGD